jgi:hypothetical protein
MWNTGMAVLAVLAVLEGLGAAERPACRAALVGQMWPAEANDDRRLALELSRKGELWICQRGPWKHSWTSPTVHIRQLRAKAAGKTKAPEAAPETRLRGH